MKNYNVNLAEEYGLQGGTLECILLEKPWDLGHEDWKRPAVIVVPGGGYGYASKREADCVATRFLAAGYQVFVLTYLCQPDGVHYPEQLLELASSVDYIRKHAEVMKVNPDEIFAVGFSAGGHLVANLAVDHQNVSQKAGRPLDCKLTAVGLCYPVISKIHGHQGSYQNLLDGYTEEAKEELLKVLNLDEMVNEQTPPAFLWATAKDTCVPPDNALRYAFALDKLGIDYELHIYPCGNHGLGTCDFETNVVNPAIERNRRWVLDCAEFFRMYVKETF